jgi:hypothetical protein
VRHDAVMMEANKRVSSVPASRPRFSFAAPHRSPQPSFPPIYASNGVALSVAVGDRTRRARAVVIAVDDPGGRVDEEAAAVGVNDVRGVC